MIWTVIDGEVYDITNYVDQHPGGKKKILRGQSKDASEMFHRFHPGLKISNTVLQFLKIGDLRKDTQSKEENPVDESRSSSDSLPK